MLFVAGGIIIAGGRKNSYSTLQTTESLGMQDLPALPDSRESFPMTLVGSTIYMCGGYPKTADCYTLNSEEANPTWTKVTGLPKAIEDHSGVAIKTHIWYVHSATLYAYNTITGIIEQHAMPFTNALGHCAVANSTHSYVVGVGGNRDEIWQNYKAEDPSQWTMVTKLPITMRQLSCVWFQGTIHIQGGLNWSGKTLKDAFALDVNSHSLLRIADMTTARYGARAAVQDCKPAVIGGWSRGVALTFIETYNENAWETYEMALKTGRKNFGLVQYYN